MKTWWYKFRNAWRDMCGRRREWDRNSERYCGPFGCATSSATSLPRWGLMLHGAEHDTSRSHFSLMLGERLFWMELPRGWFQVRKIPHSKFSPIRRGVYRGEYGFYFGNSVIYESPLCNLTIKYGIQTDGSDTKKTLIHTFGYVKQRFKHLTIFNLDGSVFLRSTQRFRRTSDKEAYPRKIFMFKDTDCEVITATTYIEETRYQRGDGWFKWLSWFLPDNIDRSLVVRFDREQGPEKGSWKGGIMGFDYPLRPKELHEFGMRRWCKEKDLKLLTEAQADAIHRATAANETVRGNS